MHVMLILDTQRQITKCGSERSARTLVSDMSIDVNEIYMRQSIVVSSHEDLIERSQMYPCFNESRVIICPQCQLNRQSKYCSKIAP